MAKLGENEPSQIPGLMNPSDAVAKIVAKIAQDYQNTISDLAKSLTVDISAGKLAGILSPSFSGLQSASVDRLQTEISQYRSQVNTLTRELADSKDAVDDREGLIVQLQAAHANLSNRIELAVLLDRVSQEAGERVLESQTLREFFFSDSEHRMFVMSIDIRRSTELMLKATSPQKFAAFITTLCGNLDAIVKENHGVVDKFTGDGILCFFPEFFTGDDVGYYWIHRGS